MTDFLRVEGLRFAYPAVSPGVEARWVLDGLNLSVERGEWLAVMGAGDTGKTTLCLILAGLAPDLTGGQMQGRVLVEGRDTRDRRPPALADTVGLLFQEPEAQVFNPTVEAEIAWGLENLGLPEAEIERRVAEALSLVRLQALRRRPPHRLSGGEKKRVALASVLAMRPRLVILDEPLGGLDPVGREELLEALDALRAPGAAEPVTIVMTEGDPEAVGAFADRVAVLHQGRIEREGTPRELFRQPEAMASLGVAVPQMSQVNAALNRRLGTHFEALTPEDTGAALAVAIG